MPEPWDTNSPCVTWNTPPWPYPHYMRHRSLYALRREEPDPLRVANELALAIRKELLDAAELAAVGNLLGALIAVGTAADVLEHVRQQLRERAATEARQPRGD